MCKAQSDSALDSLLKIVKDVPSSPRPHHDTILIETLNSISKKYLENDNYSQAIVFANRALEEANKINYQNGKIDAYNILGNLNLFLGDYKNALDNYHNCLKICNETSDKIGMSVIYNNIGAIYYYQGNYEKTLINYFTALKIREELDDKSGLSTSYNNVGGVYGLLGNNEKALKFYYKSLKLADEINNKSFQARAYNNIGLCYSNQKEYEKALENYFRALEIEQETNSKKGIATTYNNIGNIYMDQKVYKKALDVHFKGLRLQEEIGFQQGILSSYTNIGNIYLKLDEFSSSHYYISKALKKAESIGAKDDLKQAYQILSELFNKQENYEQAYKYHKLCTALKDSLFNDRANKQITEMNAKYESEKKEKNILLLTKDKELQHAEIDRQKLIRNGFIGGLGLTLLLTLLVFNRFRETRTQKKIIEYQNSQIVESINYSKKIQDALLPSIESMQMALPDLFVFYEPKNIVSGDFYFFKEFKNYILLACVDCTGHGVPGGFMSTLGSLLLDKITNDESLKPSEILTKLNNEIIRILHQQSGGELQDGMDLSVCLIDGSSRKVEFSGARNGIIVVTNNEAKRYKASPLPVGGNYMKKGVPLERNFQTQSISLNSNDWVYMYTDGFVDQIGGTENVPMNYEQFEKQLIALSKNQAKEEKIETLQYALNDWTGTNARTDDVLIIGFSVA